jgi:hypothetical protein
MAQIFEVTWSEGTVTPELISSLLRQYVTQGGLYGTVVVKEAAQQSVQPTIATAALEDSPFETGMRRNAVVLSNRNSG